MVTTQLIPTRRFFLALMVSFFVLGWTAVPNSLKGQTSGEQISWDDDEDEEAESLLIVEDVTILVNEEEFDIKEDLEFEKNQTLDVGIRHLRPNSQITVHLEKAGMKLTKQRYQANEKGELDLEIKTGKKKVKGTAKIWYTPNGADRIERKVKVKVI